MKYGLRRKYGQVSAMPIGQRFSNCGAPFPPRGTRVDCMRNILILNEIWLQGKIYISIGNLLG
jgi:hypothetical protein